VLLYEPSPWRTALVEAAWLVAIGVVLVAGARALMRRLAA
jgi:hypothetical protein